ncbi:DUF547 domain-containing protein [uncultured Winogradskyella sp.]|uniref:DUF547 domain-containing protein n=1 Tax=uncultured Winogradskyella sp. TaxID=395353 RepID=UPI0030DBD98B|tara:strand:+ start:26258 stop:27163 length:906 start_codon:yes stop_codon:yes gene_type:complete
MKYFTFLIIVLFITSCSSTKKTIKTNTKPIEDVVIVTEVPDVLNAEHEKNVWTEVEETPIESKKNDSVEDIEIDEDTSFYQEVSKREGYLHDLFTELLQKHVSKNGNVDYKGFKKSRAQLLAYIGILENTYPKLDSLSKNEKLAYWINTYNALTIDLILRNYPTKSIKDIKDPWDQRLWKFGDKWLNLNDIEHKILRHMNEPRIHFAIVCASVSCPKLQNVAFTALNLDAQLIKATKEFLNDTSKNKLSEDRIQLSKIFKWFKKDFENRDSIIDFLNLYADIKISSKAKKSFMDYNWNLND